MDYIKKQIDNQVKDYVKGNFSGILQDYFGQQVRSYLEEAFGEQIKESVRNYVRGHFVDAQRVAREISFKEASPDSKYIEMIEKDRAEEIKKEEKPVKAGNFLERRITKDMEYGSLSKGNDTAEREAYDPDVQMYYREKEKPGTILRSFGEEIPKNKMDIPLEKLQSHVKFIKKSFPAEKPTEDNIKESLFPFPIKGFFNLNGRGESQLEFGDNDCNDCQPPVFTKKTPKVQNHLDQKELRQEGERSMAKEEKKEHDLDDIFKDPHAGSKQRERIVSDKPSMSEYVKNTYHDTDDPYLKEFGIGWEVDNLEVPPLEDPSLTHNGSINANQLKTYIEEGRKYSLNPNLPKQTYEPPKKKITKKPEDLIKKGVFEEDEVKYILESSAKSRLTPLQKELYDDGAKRREKFAEISFKNGKFPDDRNSYDEYVDKQLYALRDQNNTTDVDYSLGEACPENKFGFFEGSLAELITKEKNARKTKKDEIDDDFEVIHS